MTLPPLLFGVNGLKKLSVPVFSLATLNEDGSTNMNVVTYASPVGIEPERLWMISLYQVRYIVLWIDNVMRLQTFENQKLFEDIHYRYTIYV